MNKTTEIFERQRPQLFRLAYGMLGRAAPAEDAVQETFLRWQKQDIGQIDAPGAYLSTIVSRICLDELKSARNRKEQYIGPNLPEPILSTSEKPDEVLEMAESLSMALLVVLDELTPVQRAVFILREIFDYEYAAIAGMINKSESHCRKIAQRARDRIRENKPHFEGNIPEQHKLVKAFLEAVKGGDLSEIESLLAEEAILYSDGGGKVTAARKPVAGAEKIAKFLLGIQKHGPPASEWSIDFREINGAPGFILRLNGEVYNVWSFHIEDDKIQNIYVVLNPDKLDHLKRHL